MTMFMTLSIIVSMVFPMLNHPLSMGLMLIIQTLLVAMITGMMINMFWFSYILIMTMLSGALVLFIYMASVASNEKFYSSISSSTIIIPIMLMSLTTLFLVDQMGSSKIWSTSKKSMVMNDQMMNLAKLFNMHNMFITLFMINYLLFTMICVSYIVNVYEGPLRTKN
uniref:NADH-ubiquinone oxidoreductase chain 6 n=1 Tax=Reduvius tenebrosus TaxID=1347737 RepID=A0A342CF81_9HEMI|nr:NADH dehydrogenase subunit 6 [Reduvius tenebrosus]AGO28021.1 NADH dehydrogenase subunit 6 [Reduvius tenebrosus]